MGALRTGDGLVQLGSISYLLASFKCTEGHTSTGNASTTDFGETVLAQAVSWTLCGE